MSKDKHFIPSPFTVVTQYENQFIKEGNENMARAIAEVLHYVASATAFAIKNKQLPNNDIEKAHQIGDLHSNGLWVWTEYKPGKFDWRAIKKKKEKKVEIWQINSNVDKFVTVKQCQDYLYDKGYIKDGSDITKLNLGIAKQICSTLDNLHDFIPFQPVYIFFKKLGRSTFMDSWNGIQIRINTNLFTDFDNHKHWENNNTLYVERLKSKLEYCDDLLKDTTDEYSKKKLLSTIKKIEKRLNKSSRWIMGDKDSFSSDIILHEMGHILNTQCSGVCGLIYFSKEEKKICDKLNEEWAEIFKRYKKEAKAFSQYSLTSKEECFAESFVAWLHRDESLPKYIGDFLNKYFKLRKPKR